MSSLEEKYSDIIVNRYGKSPNSNMTTMDVLSEVYNYKNYIINQDVGLVETDKPCCGEPIPDGINRYVAIENTWNRDSLSWTGDSNILGESGTITLDAELTIPVSKIFFLAFNCIR